MARPKQTSSSLKPKPADAQLQAKGHLVLVPTPIGHLGDMTFRAVEVLKGADCIAAEDTRTSGILLQHYGIQTRTFALHDHNEDKAIDEILTRLAAGATVAQISDAGTPGLADPGYRLIARAIAAGYAVTALPGANALLPALLLSGLPPHPFYFGGFLPPRTKARQKALAELAPLPATLAFYEAPHRLAESLADALTVLGPRQAAVVREISKVHEEARRGTLDNLRRHYHIVPARGEIVVVIAGAEKEIPWDEEAVMTALSQAFEKGSRFRDAVSLIAAQCHWPKRQVYDLALQLRRQEDA